METMQEIHASAKRRLPGRFSMIAVMLLAMGLGLGACGSSGGDTGGSSGGNLGASSGGNGGNDPGDSLEERSAALVEYSQCMRENGVPSFPDPVGGRLQLRVQRGGELDPDNPQFQAAQKACKSLEPAGLGSPNQGGGQQAEDMLRFVDCMRENGVANFPDPQPDGRILINRGAGVDPESAEFQAAEETCRQLLPGGVAPGGPGGP